MEKTGLAIHHVALKCKDFEKSIAFYKAIGLTEYSRLGTPEREIVLMKFPQGGMMELFSDGGDMFPEEGKYVHLALTSSNVEEDYNKALVAGAKPLTPPKTVQLSSNPVPLTLHLAFVKGPDGEQLEFINSVERR